MKKLFLLLTILIFICHAPQLSQKEQASKLVETIFGEHSVDLSPVSRIFLEELFYTLATATPYEQMIACKRAAKAIHTERLEVEAQALTSKAYIEKINESKPSSETLQVIYMM